LPLGELGGSGRGGEETGGNTTCHLCAWGGEGGLADGVVLGVELKGHGIALGSHDLGRVESENTIGTDRDKVVDSRDGGNSSGKSGDSEGGTHFQS
jgi:hypothetical protein